MYVEVMLWDYGNMPKKIILKDALSDNRKIQYNRLMIKGKKNLL